MLQKCMLTVDPNQVQHLLDHLGEGYDQAVLECQDQLAGICLICYPIKLIHSISSINDVQHASRNRPTCSNQQAMIDSLHFVAIYIFLS